MFVMTKAPDFWWPVKVRQPSRDKLAFEEHVFEARFKALTPAEAEALDLAETVAAGKDGRAPDHVGSTLRGALLDWRGVVDEAGQEIGFGPSTLDAMMSIGWRKGALFEAYAEAMSGQVRAKN